MFSTEKGTRSMPWWEKILLFSVVIISAISLYFAIFRNIECQKISENTNNVTTTTTGTPNIMKDASINDNTILEGIGFRLVSRTEWGAQPPINPPKPLGILPAPLVIISHTVTTFCYTQAQCMLNVRVAQTFHIESKGWDDIAYNFLVGGDSIVYEGRGWDVQGTHTYNYNWKSIGISFIGIFNKDSPSEGQLNAAKKLIEYGVEIGKISKDYKLLGHRQCAATQSPGEALYNIIKTWDHWAPTP